MGIINEFHEAFCAGSSAEVTGQILTKLIATLNDHFGREERLMKEAAYPGFDAHIKVHGHLGEEITTLWDIKELESEDGSARIGRFLRKWLVEHVMNEDTKFAQFRAQQVEKSSARA